MSESSRTRDVSQRKLIRNREQVSESIQYLILYYKAIFMSIDKLLNVSNSYMLLCGIDLCGESIEKEGGG